MKIFYLLLLFSLFIGCENPIQKKKTQLEKELGSVSILSIKFDSLLNEIRSLPNQQKVSCLLQISFRDEKEINGILKQESCLKEALFSTSSLKNQKRILLQLVTIYNKLDNQNIPNACTQGLNYINKLEQYSLSQEENWQVKKIKALLLNKLGKQEEYLPIWFELLKEHRQANKTSYIIEDLYTIATQFEKLGDYKQALPLYEEAYQLAKNNQNTELQSQCLFSLINILYNAGYYKKTLVYCDSIKGTSNCNKQFAIKQILVDCYLKLNKPDSARYYLASLLTSTKGSPIINAQIAESFIIENNEDSASFYIKKTLHSLKEKNQTALPPYLLQTYSSFAKLLQRNGKNQESSQAFLLVEPLMKEKTSNSNDLKRQIDALTHFSSFCRDTKQYEKALDLLAHRDSIQLIYNDIQKKQDSKNLADRFEIQELNHALDLKETKLRYVHRLLILSTTCGLIVITILTVIFYLYKKQVKQRKMLYLKNEKQQKTEEVLLKQRNTNPENILFIRATNLIKKQKLFLDDKINVIILAEMLKTNRTYLSKAINICTGNNFNTWFNSFRINYAIELMRDNPFIEIKRLSSQCGFNSTETFNRNFIQQCGIKPREYQKQIIIEQNTPQVDDATQDKEK